MRSVKVGVEEKETHFGGGFWGCDQKLKHVGYAAACKSVHVKRRATMGRPGNRARFVRVCGSVKRDSAAGAGRSGR